MSSRYFFSKQNTAYEVRISDWSSDVCSSDLLLGGQRGAGLHGDEGAGRLAPALVRPGDHRRLHDLGMPEQHVLDLQRRDVLAARDDDVLGAVLDLAVAVGMQHRQVAAAEPDVGERLAGRRRVLQVPLHDGVYAQPELADGLA